MNNDVKYVIALYVRLSIEDSKVESMSIQNQLITLHQYADTLEGVRNTEVLEFIDNGYSGTNFERPAIQELLDMVRAGRVHCVMVKDFTRFGRNSIEVGYFIERVFPVFGIRFLSINDAFDSDELHGDTGGLKMAFKYVISELYSLDMSQKSKSAKYIKMKHGEYQSKLCPYGYCKGADGCMEIDEETAVNVRLIFELAHTGHTAQEIVKALYEKGVLTPGEHKAAKGQNCHDVSRCRHIWQRSTVLRILTDERYTGTYVIGKREVVEIGSSRVRLKDESKWFKVPDHHPAMIKKEVFEQIQVRLPHPKGVKRVVHEYPLRGKVFCGCCRHAMPRTGKYPVFSCRYTRVDDSADCHDLRIRESDLEATLYSIISKQAEVILNLDDLSNTEHLEAQFTQKSEYDLQIQQYHRQKRELYERYLLKQIGVDAYREQKAVYDAELYRLKQICTALTAQTQTAGEAGVRIKAIAENIAGSSGMTAVLADALIDKVYVYPGNQLEIVWKMKEFWGDNDGQA